MRINLKILSALVVCAPLSFAQIPSLTTLYSFAGGTDGGAPYGGLLVSKSGALIGSAYSGGSSAFGTVFELTNTAGSWSQSVVHSFTGYPNDGANPYANLVMSSSGALYGTTSSGGAIGSGSVYELTRSGGAWTETPLYNFFGESSGHDGANPHAGVALGANGKLYGTTSRGGTMGNGTVFQLTPPPAPGGAWSETVIYRFTGLNGDGAFPQAGLVIGKNGTLYGTTENGGSGCACGIVFKLSPPTTKGGAWTETILYSFQGANDGAYPEAGLVLASNGSLYGTTYQGGPAGLGTVFQLTPAGKTWTKTTLYSFQGGADGAYPFAGLTLGANGSLYGTTVQGGNTGNGTVFQLTPPSAAGGAWTESILYSFSGSDGSAPYAGVVFGKNGALFGVTTAGGTGNGTVFELTL